MDVQPFSPRISLTSSRCLFRKNVKRPMFYEDGNEAGYEDGTHNKRGEENAKRPITHLLEAKQISVAVLDPR